MNTRLLEFLVEEMGFNAFANGDSMPEAFLVNAYVQTGVGDPERLLLGIPFWVWHTQEWLDTIQWTRAHNEKPGATQLSFYGFDIPYSRLPLDNAVTYLKRVDPAQA